VVGVAVKARTLLLDTRIVDFHVHPTKVKVGDPVTIAGVLQYHTPVLCWWNALEGKPIEILADSTKIGNATTTEGGGFRFTWYPREVGVYWVKARFPGDLIYDGVESQPVMVEVVTEEEWEEAEREKMLFWSAICAAGAIAAVAIAVAYVRR